MNSKVLLAWVLLAMACTQKNSNKTNELRHIKRLPVQEISQPDEENTAAVYPFTLEDYYGPNKKLEDATERVFRQMAVQERAAQLVMPATGLYKDYGLPFKEILSLCRQKIIGSALLLKGNKYAFRQLVQKINELTKENKSIPLLFAIDGEPTLIHRKLTDVDSMLPASKQHTDGQVNTTAQKMADLLHKIGAQLNFAPVADRNENADIIDRRSFGPDPDSIVHKAGLFISGHRENNKACVIKHFPGHGMVKGDSHHTLVFIDGEMTELPAFAKLLKTSQPAGVMMGHIAIKNNPAWNTNGLPASLSPVIMKQLLRDSLNFKGVIFTDAMNMKAVASLPEADFRSLVAGADVILMPKNVIELHKKIVTAMQKGGNTGLQLEESVKRVIKLKICLGIISLPHE